jgi:hypothetical protein
MRSPRQQRGEINDFLIGDPKRQSMAKRLLNRRALFRWTAAFAVAPH